MNDTISRQAVLKAIDEYDRLSAVSQTVRNATSLREIIKWLPSAQPKKGKWIPYDWPWYKCSVCGAEREHKIFMEYFCPNCGADMRGEQDG